MQIGITLAQAQHDTETDAIKAQIDDNWILLDTCSTASVCKNPSLVSNIKPCNDDDRLHIVTNGGSMCYEMIADFNFLPLKVHCNPLFMANILSLSDAAAISGARVTMDSVADRALFVHLDNGKIIKFKECTSGLYYCDARGLTIKAPVTDYSLLQTVKIINLSSQNKKSKERTRLENYILKLVGLALQNSSTTSPTTSSKTHQLPSTTSIAQSTSMDRPFPYSKGKW